MITESTIVVTCATGEIGSAIAKKLAKKHNLILVGRDKAKLEILHEQLTSLFKNQYTTCQVDYTDLSAGKRLKEVLGEQKLSGIVVITPRPQIALLDDQEKWLETLQSCFTGPSSVMKTALSNMPENGNIVVISGITSVQLSPDYAGTSGIRRLWSSVTKGLSYELGPKNIRVNTVSPGTVLTSHHKMRIANKAAVNHISFDAQLEKEVADTPLKRYADTQDVARAVKFFITNKSSHVTGQNLLVDGGITKAY